MFDLYVHVHLIFFSSKCLLDLFNVPASINKSPYNWKRY